MRSANVAFAAGAILIVGIFGGLIVGSMNDSTAQNAPPGPTLTQLNNAAAQRPPVVTPITLPEVDTYASSVNAVSTVPASLFGFDLTEGATAGYFAFLDVAATPAAGASISPKACIYAAAASSMRARQVVGDLFQSGLTIVSTSSCTTYTAITPVLIGAQVK